MVGSVKRVWKEWSEVVLPFTSGGYDRVEVRVDNGMMIDKTMVVSEGMGVYQATEASLKNPSTSRSTRNTV